jgi:polyketide synthase 12
VVLTIPRGLGGEGTVLISGGTGTLGGLVARHVVKEHGVRHLVLCSRRGGGEALQRELEVLGATVQIATCDVGDRASVSQLLSTIPAAHPLSAVIHTAGVVDDGVLEAQDAERLERVFGPKVDGALHLDELTRGEDLSAFVLFSSVAGVLGNAGQTNYAAANAVLDGLAYSRRARGLPAVSLAWGLWEQCSGLTSQLGEAETARLGRSGLVALSNAEGLSLLDAALVRAEPVLVPVRLDMRTLSQAASSGALPSKLQGLVRARALAAAPSGLKQRLSGLSASEQRRVVFEVVTSTIATVLSTSVQRIEPDRQLSALGLDSLMALEVRNRLGAAVGRRLPPTLLFDYPTPSAVAEHLFDAFAGESETPSARSLLADLQRIDGVVSSLRADHTVRLELATALQQLLAKWNLAAGGVPEGDRLAENVASADDDELFRLIDQKLKTRGASAESGGYLDSE